MEQTKKIMLAVGLGGLIVIGTVLNPPRDRAAAKAAIRAKEAEIRKIREFCVANAKPFSTSVSYDQDEGTKILNGERACMREKGVEGYENAPLPVKH